jgi:hypothetical protein
MLKVIAASLLGRKAASRAEATKRVLARREIESLFQDDLADHALIKEVPRKAASPTHA